MRQHPKHQGFARQPDTNEQGGNTQTNTVSTAAAQPEVLGEQIEPVEVQDDLTALKAEIEAAINSPDTHTAAALADLCQVSSATIRNRWASAIEQAISPFPLRADDGRYTDLAAWAFADYRKTVAIESIHKQAWIAQVQALLPAQQLFLVDAIEPEPELEAGALAIVPVSAAITVDAEWLDDTAAEIDDRLESISQLQLDLSTTIATAGSALEVAMRRLADQHAASAALAYQSQLQANMAQIMGQTTEATTAKKPTRSRAKSVA